MGGWWPVAGLILLVTAISLASRQATLRQLFRWLPVPLWCYALPIASVALHLLPSAHPAYAQLTTWLLPVALACLLLGVDLPAIAASGRQALAAAAIGAAGIMVGAPLGVWLLQGWLPPEAWKGAGALAATWTGGTMNLLSMRSVLAVPDGVFAPLIVVDAAVAYGWMALLVAGSARQHALNRWLGASWNPPQLKANASTTKMPRRIEAAARCVAGAVALTWAAAAVGSRLPTSSVVSSASGWTVLLVTTGALGLSLLPAVHRLAAHGQTAGSWSLCLVLAATGAQANLPALWSAPAWMLVGGLTAALHGTLLLLAGRRLRIPIGLLATASQANLGGVVSAPLVGAVYHQSFVPIGLLLAVAGNALGTYLGLLSATLARWLTAL
ncbi:MAG: DUF819 family protein [Candidatus Omnitrophica bacterium]|nr:DUF819 family protein [Candidatus Omnitrophota bacterium]